MSALESDVFFLYRLPLCKFSIDNMIGESGASSSSTRLMYNGRSFFITFNQLKFLGRYVDSLGAIDYEKDVFFVAKKIDSHNYLILWLGDSQGSELKMDSEKDFRGQSVKWALLSFVLSSALIYFWIASENSDTSVIYFVASSFSILSFLFFFHSFIFSFRKDIVYINKILNSDIKNMLDDFISLNDISAVNYEDYSLNLPKEFNNARGIVEDIQVKKRQVSWNESHGGDQSSVPKTCNKAMIHFSFNNNHYVFEFEIRGQFTYCCEKISPFIALNDEVEVFWYSGIHETRMRELFRDYDDDTLPVICLYNRTSNTLFHGRRDITPSGYFEIVGTGLRDSYEIYCDF